MPRPAGLIRLARAAAFALAFLAGLASPGSNPGTALAQDASCARELRLTAAADGLVDLRVSAPCDPYARVDIAYGPLVLTEETSHEGHVDLRLPRLAAVPEAAAQIGDAVLFAALPAAPEGAQDYVALIWSGDADLSLALPESSTATHRLRLGFPFGPNARRAEIVVLSKDTPAPAWADIAIGGQPCAYDPIRAALVTSADRDRLPLTLPAPGCGPAQGAARLALPGAAP